MCKLRKLPVLLGIVLLVNASAVLGNTLNTSIDQSQLAKGIVSVGYTSQKSAQTKVMISKGNVKYTYNLESNNQFPLQLGDGLYNISVLENVQGNKYRVVAQEEVAFKAKQPNEVFLQSIQIINWNTNMSAVKKAKELTKNAKNDQEKVAAIYQYIVQNIKYDENKASQVKPEYVPDIEDTLKSLKGICYDYSALFAAMLRSVDVPAKLVMGRKNDIAVYHAWNQVYLKDTNEWVTVDTTYDAGLIKAGLSYKMVKNNKEYSVEKEY